MRNEQLLHLFLLRLPIVKCKSCSYYSAEGRNAPLESQKRLMLPFIPVGAVFFAKRRGTSVVAGCMAGVRSRSPPFGSRSYFAELPQRFLQHCKKRMRDGFASSSSSSFYSSFFYKIQGFIDRGLHNSPLRGGRQNPVYPFWRRCTHPVPLSQPASPSHPRQGFAQRDANQDGPAA